MHCLPLSTLPQIPTTQPLDPLNNTTTTTQNPTSPTHPHQTITPAFIAAVSALPPTHPSAPSIIFPSGIPLRPTTSEEALKAAAVVQSATKHLLSNGPSAIAHQLPGMSYYTVWRLAKHKKDRFR